MESFTRAHVHMKYGVLACFQYGKTFIEQWHQTSAHDLPIHDTYFSSKKKNVGLQSKSF